jgi:phenylpyruvate tautomerase PptA (4-oxalocrotonate tautomerase family)
MPVFQIRALPQKKDFDPVPVMKRLCSQVAEVMKLESRHVWATWEELKPGYYVEGEVEAREQAACTHPPIVNFIAFEGRSPEMIREALEIAARVIATSMELDPGNVFITFQEARSGQVFTGGAVKNLHQ